MRHCIFTCWEGLGLATVLPKLCRVKRVMKIRIKLHLAGDKGDQWDRNKGNAEAQKSNNPTILFRVLRTEVWDVNIDLRFKLYHSFETGQPSNEMYYRIFLVKTKTLNKIFFLFLLEQRLGCIDAS